MQVEQAIFTSARGRRSQGYHLVAQSMGVGAELSRLLNIWGPSHASLIQNETSAESFNFSAITADWYAVSRTIHGGPEYSGRGGLQVFTRFLLLRRQHLEAFDNNSLALMRTAQTLGLLRLELSTSEVLEPVELPERALSLRAESAVNNSGSMDEVMRVLQFQKRVAILGLDNPMPTLAKILRGTPREDRLKLSYSTGLKPSVHRDFRLHFMSIADANVQSQLASQGIDAVAAV